METMKKLNKDRISAEDLLDCNGDHLKVFWIYS